MTRLFWLFILSVAAGLLLAAGGAAAAPQLLGLVASNGMPDQARLLGRRMQRLFRQLLHAAGPGIALAWLAL